MGVIIAFLIVAFVVALCIWLPDIVNPSHPKQKKESRSERRMRKQEEHKRHMSNITETMGRVSSEFVLVDDESAYDVFIDLESRLLSYIITPDDGEPSFVDAELNELEGEQYIIFDKKGQSWLDLDCPYLVYRKIT